MMKNTTDPVKCHESAKGTVPEKVGCNDGMLLSWILKRKKVRVKRVPQRQFPIARAMNLAVDNDHKSDKNPATPSSAVCVQDQHCQSTKKALMRIPDDIKFCEDVFGLS